MADDPHTHQLGSGQADQLREQDRHRQSDQQGQHAAHQILSQKHEKEPASAHPQHQVDAELMPAALQLILTGKIDQEEQDAQGHDIKHRDNEQKPVDGVALHLPQEQHDILMGQGKDDIKRHDRNNQGAEKQPVFLPAPPAVP